MFQAKPVPRGSGLRSWLQETVFSIANALRRPQSEYIILDVLETAPAKPQNGMIAHADGTSWNPGQRGWPVFIRRRRMGEDVRN